MSGFKKIKVFLFTHFNTIIMRKFTEYNILHMEQDCDTYEAKLKVRKRLALISYPSQSFTGFFPPHFIATKAYMLDSVIIQF